MPSLSIFFESSEFSIDFSREVISGMIESKSSEFAYFSALSALENSAENYNIGVGECPWWNNNLKK